MFSFTGNFLMNGIKRVAKQNLLNTVLQNQLLKQQNERRRQNKFRQLLHIVSNTRRNDTIGGF
jgi:hypothetical protein